jgi:YVTN family beta-propeller protein
VTIYTSSPTTPTGDTITFGANGAPQGGNWIIPSAGQSPNASITVNGKISASDIVTFRAGMDVNTPMSVVSTIPMNSGPAAVAINPTGTFAYVANTDGGTVSVIRTSDNVVVADVPVGSYARGLAVTPNGDFVYVTNHFSNNVSVIRTSDNTVIATVDVGAKPRGVAVNPEGSLVYVTNWDSNTVSIISTDSNAVVGSVAVGSNPWDVAISPDGSKAYVVNTHGNSVSVIRTSDNSVVKTIPVGSVPFGVSFNPNNNSAYVVNCLGNSVSVIDVYSDSTVSSFPAGGSNPLAITVNPSGTFAYVTNATGGVNDGISIIRLSDHTIVQKVPLYNPDTFGNFIGFVNDDLVGYVGDRQLPGTVSVLRMPSISAFGINVYSYTGDINVVTHAGRVSTNTGGPGDITVTQTGRSVMMAAQTAGGIVTLGNVDPIQIGGQTNGSKVYIQSTKPGALLTSARWETFSFAATSTEMHS